MTPAQHKKNGPNKEHRCGAGQVPSEGQVRTYHNSRVLERDKLCVPWLVRVLRFLQQQSVDISLLDQKYFPFKSLFGHILWDPFLIGIPLGFTKRGEQVISLYTRYVGGKQPFIMVVSLHCPFSLNTINFMEASAFECLVRCFLTPFSSLSINES